VARPDHFAASPEALGLDPARVEDLVARARREVDAGHIGSFQLAVARDGRVAACHAYGRVAYEGRPAEAGPDTLYVIFSCTKALVSAAAWLLIQEGKLGLDERVAGIVPEFGTHGKGAVTVEQLFTHTCGFPTAPYPQDEWHDRARRLERFASWRLNFEPGSRFFYHPTSSMWVIAEIVERRAGLPLRDFVRERITRPLGLDDLRLGLPRGEQGRLADLEHRGREMTAEEKRALGFPDVPETEVTEEAIQNFNRPEVREAGVPGGGGVATAADLALFYQALLRDGRGSDGTPVWTPEVLHLAREVRTGDLRDAFFPARANRGLGIVIAGEAPERVYRGFGHTHSPLAFGHGGAGGQIAWGDPATGLSFAFLTHGFDRHQVRQARRGVALSSRAAALLQGA
jgi:CubicO group peptidase (beta-lactamase class C family)